MSDAVRSLVIDRKLSGRQETNGVEAITCATSLTLRQIGVVFRYVATAADARATAVRARSSAQSYASPAAVGAAGLVLEAMSTGDERHIADALIRCRSVFDEGELFAGAIALLVGFIEQVAELADLDVMEVAVASIATDNLNSGACRRRRGSRRVAVRSINESADVHQMACQHRSLVVARQTSLPRRELLV